MNQDPTANFLISIDGNPITNHSQIARINVVLHSDQDSLASIVFMAYPGHKGSVDFPVDVSENSVLEIALGYENAGDQSTVFSGDISALEMRIEEQTGAVFILNAISHQEFSSSPEPVLSLSYGDNLLEFDGILHLDEGKVRDKYPAEVELRILGTSNATPDSRIRIKQCNDWFDGEYDVLTVNHQVADGEWLTQLVVSV